MKRIAVSIFLWALLLCLPLFFNIFNTFPRLDSDYDSNLPVYWYMIHVLKTTHHFPIKIPLINNGLPTLGDPLNAFLNPLLSLPLLLLNINVGIRISIFFTDFLSGITMFLLLSTFFSKKIVSLWGACLYMAGGAFFAAVASGHIEKYLIYPLVPLLLLFSLPQKMSVKQLIYSSVILALTVYSGDIYATWFFFLIFLTIRFFYFFTTKEKMQSTFTILFSFVLFLCFASVKLIPFIANVLPHMQRFSAIDPYQGSLQAFFFPLPFVMPFGVWFWDRPFFQKHLGFYYNWYEYFAFISPLPFLFLLRVKKVLSNQVVKIACLILLVGMFYFSLAYIYSPFYWLFHFTPLQYPFRVPQRIVLEMTTPLVLLIAYCLEIFISQKKLKTTIAVLLVSTLLWTMVVDWNILGTTFVPISREKNMFALEVKKIDKQEASVLNFAIPQYLLIQQGIPISNYYYGWVSKNTPQFMLSNGSINLAMIAKSNSRYLLLPNTVSFGDKGYTMFYNDGVNTVWKKIDD